MLQWRMHVYVIQNLVSGKIYIGQTSEPNLRKYFVHKLWTAEHSDAEHRSTPLFNAIRKYGRNAFAVKSLVRPVDIDQLNSLEKLFIRTCDSRQHDVGYNANEGGHGNRGYVTSEETKKTLSEVGRGKKRPPITVERMRQAFLERTTREVRVAMSIEANKKRSEVLTPEQRSALAKRGSDAALAKMGPYIPKPHEEEKTCRVCRATKSLDRFAKTWVRSVRSPELGRWNYRSECKDCHNADKHIRRANNKKQQLASNTNGSSSHSS